jgi:hypothetical protein
MEGRGRHRRLSPFVQPRWLPSAPRSVNVTTPAHIPKSVAFFRRALIEALDARGKDMSPRAGMPQVKAVDREIVRAEFLKAYPAKNRKAKEMAFLRCEIDAVARSIAGHRAIGAEGSENAVYWLLK